LNKRLSQLINIPTTADRVITDLTLDSRAVKPGTVFFACQGTQSHGKRFIPTALQAGAVAVLLEDDAPGLTWQNTVPIIHVVDLSKRCGELAARFYGQPPLTIAGVTGTNGKTSITHFLAQALPCGLIGTLGSGFLKPLSFWERGWGEGASSILSNTIEQTSFSLPTPPQRKEKKHLQTTANTTPDVLSIHRLLVDFHARGAQYAALEVSSHGLVQHRVDGVRFNTAVFSNLSRDHLDYHGTLEAYAAAKKRLFQWPGLQHAVVNSDDAVGREIISELPAGVKLWRYSLRTPEAELYCRHIQALDAGYELNIVTPAGEVTVLLPLWGHFNIANALATLGVLLSWDIDLSLAGRILAQLKPVAGRLERFHAAGKPSVIVDYAHTPDALAQTLQAIRPHCRGRLWCVFGCGGDRDPGKRPLMGQVSARYADCSIITDDNPRHEASVDIIAAILPGLGDAPHHVIAERAAAIEFALQDAAPDDVILIAGKGHEAYQQIGAERLPFSDREIVEKYLQNTRLGATTGYDYD
jgi:UDP-N-acetylmuramoyl-L-alanyl-D-glutamate--2,6-diaminopimelate ligase